MRQGQVSVYYGGKGKTCEALGRGLRALGDDQRVVMIQFMEYENQNEIEYLKKFEPDFRIFRFEKDRSQMNLDEQTLQKENAAEVRNAFNFAKKIVDTGECDVLMLDGILECIEKGYVQEGELQELLTKRPQYLDIILTGSTLPPSIAERADSIYQIRHEK